MAGEGSSSSKRKSSKRKRDNTSSQKKSRRKKQKRAYDSDSSYSNDESLSPEPTSKSEHKKKIRKKKKLSSGHSTSSSPSYRDRSVSSDSDSSSRGYRRKKARRSQVIVKSAKKLDLKKSTRSGRKRKRSGRDDSGKPKVRSSKKKARKYISDYSGSDSESCSTCQSTSSSSSADREPKTSKMVTEKERERFRGRNSYEDREKLDRGSKYSVSVGHADVALSPVINNPRRLKSVIAFADHRYNDEEEVEKSRWAMNPHEEEIVYDQNDYPSLKSPESNEEGTKMELGDQSHGNLSKMIGVKDGDRQMEAVDMDNADKGKEVDDKSVLESILRQRALENLKNFKGRLQTTGQTSLNLEMNEKSLKKFKGRLQTTGQTSLNLEMNEKSNEKMPPDVTTVSSDFQRTNQNSGPSQKSDLSQITDAWSLLDSENVEKEHGIIIHTAKQLNEDKYMNSDAGLNKTVSRVDTCPGTVTTRAGINSNSKPSSSSSVGEHKLERENDAKDGSFEQKTMSVMRGWEMVQMARCNSTPNMESLTEDLLFDILIRLTSRDIRNSARLVCRKWAHLTRSRDFIRLHLHRAATGLLLHTVLHDLIFISGSQGRVETSRALYRSGPPILGISHGLVLVQAPFNPCSLRIMNPGTTETLDLPPHFGHCTLGSCLTYAAASMAYKVVQVCIKSVRNMRAFKCSILTVGADSSWRCVRPGRLSRQTLRLMCMGPPMSTEGFVHWVPYNGGSTILTLDVETEVVTKSRAPVPLRCLAEKEFFVSAQRHLTLVVALGTLSWDVWEMSPETRVWRKAFSVDLEKERLRFEEVFLYEDDGLTPVGWLNYPEGMVFAPSRGRYCILYWVRTREIESIDLPMLAKDYEYWPYQSSLVPPQES